MPGAPEATTATPAHPAASDDTGGAAPAAAACAGGTAVGCAPDAIFKQAYNVYDRIVQVGLLGHSTLAGAAVAALQGLQRRKDGRGPLAVLDAGCGDAGALAAALAAAGGSALVSAYDGLDASAPALAAALPTVQAALGPSATVRTAVGDLLAHVTGGPGVASVRAMPPPAHGYDAILSTLALHHLDSAGKTAWVGAAAALLAPGGVLVIGDVFLDGAGDSVPAWRSRSCARIKDEWPAASGLPPAECEGLASHVGACDVPETLAFYERAAAAAGLECALVAETDPAACGGAAIPCKTVVLRAARA